MITVQSTINASMEKVWELWTAPEHVMMWNNASEDWHTPFAENDLKVGGKFKYTMASTDGTMRFDFEGVYTNVVNPSLIEYEMADGRKVKIVFEKDAEGIKVIESFDPETVNPEEMQKNGWQAILDNFKKYVENATL
ncbi:SRPBCC family protein [Flavobacterium algoritolerans]|uniref:SRPBCC family protein n=1 Tax=Flavobacterium algoritolerans TaxID=3041254 RepID=A0ABT6V5X9_9FLAO|nr:SRPBCC family protein [Flavobacterium algoritolerans]MDI5893648.1 SRPBCC family protein [Flavobacterium algoritolerans]